MRFRLFCAGLTLLFSTLIFSPAIAQQFSVVHFGLGDGQTDVWGHLSESGSEGQSPAVVLMPGCGGVQTSHADWAKVLNDAGYTALIVDSLGPRSIFKGCAGTDRRLLPQNLAWDAFAAHNFLAGHPAVDPDRIAVVGWSMGATALMAAIATNGIATQFESQFSGAIAFYPYCTGRRVMNTDLLILTGELDDWTPAEPCRHLQEVAPERILTITYPGAYHAFDEVALGQGFSFPGNDGKMHLLRYNQSAHEDSIVQVREFLRARFGE